MTFSHINFRHIHNFKIISIQCLVDQKSLSPGVNVIEQRNTLNITL